MATEVKRRRGTTVEHSTFTGAIAELTVDLTKDTVVVHDGATQGGFPLLREDFSNVPSTAPFTHITLDTAIFDTSYTETNSETQGTLYWNSKEETLSLVTNGETIELGQKIEVHVKNQTGSQIDKGEVVYASGTLGASGRILVTKMIADGTIAAKLILGVAAENIANGADGKVVKFGKIRKVDTSAYSNGDILWVSTTAAGAFQNTEPVQADGEISLPIAFVINSHHNNGSLFVRITPIDENEYQNYDAGLADIAGLTPTDSTIIVGDGTNWVAESGDTARLSLGVGSTDSPTFGGLTVNGNITVTGTVDGRDVSADGADLDELYTTIGLSALTASEVNQLENINSVTISNTQWGYLGELNQSLTQASSPTFSRVVLTNQADDGTKAVRADRNVSAGNGVTGGGDLTADRTITLGTPSTTTVGGSNAVTTGSHTHALDLSGRSITLSDDADSVITFDTNTQDLGADRTFTPTIADHGDGQRGVLNTTTQSIYGSKTVINDFKVTTQIESASGFTSGVLGAGTRYDMDDGNGSFFEVDNMRIRNELRAHIFKKDIVKASNAYFFITDSAEIAETSVIADTTDTFKVLDGDENATFSHGDLLWAKNIDDDGSLQVTGVKIEVSVQPEYVWDTSEEVWSTSTVTPDSYTEFASGTVSGGIHDGKTYTEYNIYEVTSGGNLNAGDTIVRVNGGSILNDASSAQSPFIDIYDGVNTWADFQSVDKTKVRLGNLAGVSNASGYGLYTQNAFLTGSLVVGDLTKVGQYMEFDGSTLTVKGDVDITGTTIFKSAKDGSTTPTNLNEATFIDGGTIVTNTITATEIDANTITANEIAAGTITATEIDVADLFAQDATVAGTLTIGEGGSFVSDVINFDDDSFLLDASTVLLSSSGTGKIALGTDADNILPNDGVGFYADGSGNFLVGSIAQGSDSYISFDGTDVTIKTDTFDLATTNLSIDSANELITLGTGTTVNIGKIDATNFGLSLDANNFWKVSSGEYFFKVGSATNFISFDTSSGTLDIEADTFDLDATTLVIDSATNSGKIALGTTPPTAYNSGTGIYFDGTGKALIGNASSNNIQFDGTDLDIQTDTFNLTTTTFVIDSANNKIALGTSPDSITVSGTEAGFIATGSGEFKGYIDANNYLRLDSSGLDIKAETFDLEAGDLRIDSADREIQIADNTTRKVTINDNTSFSTVQTLGSGSGTVSIIDLDSTDNTVEDTSPVVNVSTYKGDRIDYEVTIDYTQSSAGTNNTLVAVNVELVTEGGIDTYLEETTLFHRFTSSGNDSVTLSGSFKTQTNDLNPASGYGYRLRFYADEGGTREGDVDFDYSITIYNQETQINKGGFISQSSPTNFISDEKIAGNFELDLPIVTGLTFDDLFPYRGKVVKYQSESDKTGTNPITGGSVTIKPYQIIQLDYTEV